MTRVYSVSVQNSGGDYQRLAKFTQMLQRHIALTSETNPVNIDELKLVTILNKLNLKGCLTFESNNSSFEIWYISSQEANSHVYSFTPVHWKSFEKKHKNAFRTSQGALFTFLPEDANDEPIIVFITDWSPSPAAGAVAIHKYHEFARNITKKDDNFFTGKFVRHPITGDLLPVWIADWVKPDFGTGAVLVNPAHDKTDLEFGRRVGLPIRFALVPENFDGDPQNWPIPPVIKFGRTIKTGFFDGLNVSEAMTTYFNTLEKHGLAVRHTDVHAGRLKIATLTSDPNGNWCFDSNSGEIINSNSSEDEKRFSLETTNLLETIASIVSDTSLQITCLTDEQDTALLFFRLLFFDLYQNDVQPERVFLIQKVQETKASQDNDAETAGLASLVRCPINEIATLKQQIFDQLNRFINVHQDLLNSNTKWNTDLGDKSSSLWQAVTKTKHDISIGNPATAFSYLYSMQKNLRNVLAENVEKENAFSGYFVAAYVLLGLEYPQGIDASAVWQAL